MNNTVLKEGQVAISKEEYDGLVRDADWLQCLELIIGMGVNMPMKNLKKYTLRTTNEHGDIF